MDERRIVSWPRAPMRESACSVSPIRPSATHSNVIIVASRGGKCLRVFSEIS